jgi:anaerobic selenocysteine-containing dehydrogenase
MVMTSMHRTFCRLCIAACGLQVEVDGDGDDARATAVRGDADHPASTGYACSKGRSLVDVHTQPDRIDGPLVRGADGELRSVSWPEALADLDARLADVVATHGVDAIGFFTGGGTFTDAAAYWSAKRLQRRLGTKHAYSTMSIDAAAKYRVGEMVTGTAALAAHADPAAKLVLMIGTNPVVSHGQTPMFENPIERLRTTARSADVWVVDPRRTETARLGNHHLPIRPGTDHVLLAFLVRGVLARADLAALRARADHVDELVVAVAPFTLERAATVTGLAAGDLTALLDGVHAAGRLAVLSGTGVTMNPGANAVEWMVWALLLATDSFDRPGGMWCNPGYLARLDRRDALPAAPAPEPGPSTRPDIARLLGEWPASLIPAEIEAGTLKALVVLGANLVTCLPDTPRAVAALRQLDLLVVADIARTPTVELATHAFGVHAQFERPDVAVFGDLFSPVVTTQYTEARLPQHPDRRATWWVAARIGAALGVEVLPTGLDLDTATDHDVLAHIVGTDTLAALQASELPWAVAPTPEPGWVEPRLPTGRWDLAPAALVEQLAADRVAIDGPPPLVLIPRRQPKRLNGTTMRRGDRADLLVHPDDAALAGVADGDVVEVASAAGALRVVATVTDAIRPGAVSIAHGWADVNVNVLIDSETVDPLTGMPVMSGTPVTIRA